MLAFYLRVIDADVTIGPGPDQEQQKSPGCHLNLNGYDDIEPEGDPLLLHVRIRVRRLQDIPISGGSFSVGIM